MNILDDTVQPVDRSVTAWRSVNVTTRKFVKTNLNTAVVI